MLEFIKNIFRRKFIRKTAGKSTSGLLPLSAIRSATVIMDAEDTGCEACKSKVEAFCKANGIKLMVWFSILPERAKMRDRLPVWIVRCLRKI